MAIKNSQQTPPSPSLLRGADGTRPDRQEQGDMSAIGRGGNRRRPFYSFLGAVAAGHRQKQNEALVSHSVGDLGLLPSLPLT